MAVQSENTSKTNLLKAAKALFWKHGIRRISVEEICREAGVSKMTFYRNFKNKEVIALQVLNNLQEKGFQDYRAIMQEDIPFSKKIKALIQLKLKEIKGISKEFVQDLYQNKDPKFRQNVEANQNRMLQEIMKDFKAAQDKGALQKDLKLEFILYLLNDLTTKVMDKQLNQLYDSEEDLIMALTNHFFYGILNESK